jgi:spore coat protein U-like protein
MTRIIIFALVVLAGCNPVKRAMKQKAEIDKAIAEWVLENPMPLDSVYIAGDTIVKRDTFDHQIFIIDTVTIDNIRTLYKTQYKTITQYVTRTDTITRTVNNNAAINTLMGQNAKLAGVVEAKEKERKKLFWVVMALSALTGAITVFSLSRFKKM